eukprot:2559108-Amphidinium_carterae.1
MAYGVGHCKGLPPQTMTALCTSNKPNVSNCLQFAQFFHPPPHWLCLVTHATGKPLCDQIGGQRNFCSFTSSLTNWRHSNHNPTTTQTLIST